MKIKVDYNINTVETTFPEFHVSNLLSGIWLRVANGQIFRHKSKNKKKASGRTGMIIRQSKNKVLSA